MYLFVLTSYTLKGIFIFLLCAQAANALSPDVFELYYEEEVEYPEGPVVEVG